MPSESFHSKGGSPEGPRGPRETQGTRGDAHGRRPRQAWYALLLLPFIGMLWVPFYNRIEPRAGAIPFFYWYQFAWIGISAALTAVVYFATRTRDANDASAATSRDADR